MARIIYTPAAGYNGSDSITIRASDGVLLSPTAVMTIEVYPVAPPLPARGRVVGIKYWSRVILLFGIHPRV
jgi:hypothetical protein